MLWKGETFPIGTLGGREFVVSDAARALGLTVVSDKATGVLTISGGGHQVLLGPGTAQVPVDRRIVPISGPARLVGGALYAPPDFFEKVLFPIGGAAGSYDASKKTWTLVPAGPPPLSIEIAVVHVAPTTQVVFRLSAAAKTATASSEKSFQVRFADTKIDPPFPEKRYEDPLVASVRFAGELATIDFREPGLAARAYPLSSPDRLVVEIGRRAALPPAPPAPPEGAPPSQDVVPAAPGSGGTPLTIVVDPGHGGGETGAIGPGGYEEKEATLAIAQRIAATLPRSLACRAVLTRDSDIQLPLDDRTSIANHEKADLFLSIHANSSRSASAQGSETYYLSLEASDKVAQEVASRENASNGGDAPGGPDGGHRQPRPRLRAVGPGAKRPPEGVLRDRRGDPGRAERRVGHRQPRDQAGALPRPRRRDDAGRSRRGRVHLERRRGEAASHRRVPAGRRRCRGARRRALLLRRLPPRSARRRAPVRRHAPAPPRHERVARPT